MTSSGPTCRASRGRTSRCLALHWAVVAASGEPRGTSVNGSIGAGGLSVTSPPYHDARTRRSPPGSRAVPRTPSATTCHGTATVQDQHHGYDENGTTTVSNKRRENGYDRHIRSGDIGYRRPCDNPESATRGRRGRAADARTTRAIDRRPCPRPRPARAATGPSHRGRNRAHPRGHRVHRTLRHRPPHPRLDTSRTGRTRLPPQPPGRPPHPNPPPTHNTNQPNQPGQPAPASDTRPGRRRRPHPPTHRSARRSRHGWAPTRTDSAHGNRRPTHHDRTCLTPTSPIGVAGHAAIPQPVRAVTGNPAAAAMRLPGPIADCALRRRSARRTPRRGAHRRQVAQTSGGADVRVGRRQGGQRSGSGDAVAAGVTPRSPPCRSPLAEARSSAGLSRRAHTGRVQRYRAPRPTGGPTPAPATTSVPSAQSHRHHWQVPRGATTTDRDRDPTW